MSTEHTNCSTTGDSERRKK